MPASAMAPAVAVRVEEAAAPAARRPPAFAAAGAARGPRRRPVKARSEEARAVRGEAEPPCPSGRWHPLAGAAAPASWLDVGRALLLAELGSASAATRAEEQQRDDPREQLDYYVSFGDAVRTLREDIPRQGLSLATYPGQS